MKNALRIFLLASTLGSTTLIYTQCGQNAHLYRASQSEQEALEATAFSTQKLDNLTDLVEDNDDLYEMLWNGSDSNFDLGDSYLPINVYKEDSENFQWVSRCNQFEEGVDLDIRAKALTSIIQDDDATEYSDMHSAYEIEKKYVQRLAVERLKKINEGENLPLIVPVEYSLSTGDKHDKISYMAYVRSILREDHSGKGYLETSNKTYKVDTVTAKSEFLEGKMQYFSIVTVDTKVKSNYRNYTSFASGNPFSAWNAYNMHKTGSGLRAVSDIAEYATANPSEEFPIGKIYLADLRTEILSTNNDIEIMYSDVASVGRNKDVERRLKDIFNLKSIFRKRQKISGYLSSERTVKNKSYTATYKAYEGIPQVLQRMNCDVGNSRVISARYTPIVLDLGRPYLRTTSEFWGVFFNLANASITENDESLVNTSSENSYSHRSAWLGGRIQKVQSIELADTSTTGIISPKDYMWQRVADDGFLILPPSEGEVTSVHLFGSEFKNPNAPEKKYDNGFTALQDFVGKELACKTPVQQLYYEGTPSEEQLEIIRQEVKDRYIGPWSAEYKTLKIWIDKNINGTIEDGELSSLKDQGVLAINTCITSNSLITEYDQYGNNTTLRSAFLYNESQKEYTEEEILHQLIFGKTEDDKKANFRILVDIYFKARPFHFLERSLPYRESISNSKKYRILHNNKVYEDESLPADPVFMN